MASRKPEKTSSPKAKASDFIRLEQLGALLGQIANPTESQSRDFLGCEALRTDS
jgi:hypothetical protein